MKNIVTKSIIFLVTVCGAFTGGIKFSQATDVFNLDIEQEPQAITEQEFMQCVADSYAGHPNESYIAQLFFYCINQSADTNVFLFFEDIDTCLETGKTDDLKYVSLLTSCLNNRIEEINSQYNP